METIHTAMEMAAVQATEVTGAKSRFEICRRLGDRANLEWRALGFSRRSFRLLPFRLVDSVMPLAWFVTALLILFGVYSVAPVFGLDEAYPQVFRPYGPLSWAMAGLVVLGALWWGAQKVRRSGLKKDPSPRDAKRDAIRELNKR